MSFLQKELGTESYTESYSVSDTVSVSETVSENIVIKNRVSSLKKNIILLLI
jgi:hypothetical protein